MLVALQTFTYICSVKIFYLEETPWQISLCYYSLS